jgi:hypothetical protein
VSLGGRGGKGADSLADWAALMRAGVQRYSQWLASLEEHTAGHQDIRRLSPSEHDAHGRPDRGFDPFVAEDEQVLQVLFSGEHARVGLTARRLHRVLTTWSQAAFLASSSDCACRVWCAKLGLPTLITSPALGGASSRQSSTPRTTSSSLNYLPNCHKRTPRAQGLAFAGPFLAIFAFLCGREDLRALRRFFGIVVRNDTEANGWRRITRPSPNG